jgi:LacI family transcriptional regulator
LVKIDGSFNPLNLQNIFFMNFGQATIKDIARELKISVSTVSRALKDYPGISQKTKDKVKKLAEELNYRPNAVALSLRKNKSFTIGVIVPEIVHFFFSTVISGIEEIANKNGYNVVLCQTNEKLDREISSIQTMLDNRIDGLMVSFSKETVDFEHFKNLLDKDFPIVFFDRTPEIANAVSVMVDDWEGAYQAVNHLIEQGYNKIAHLSGPKNLPISQKRKKGYLDALKEAGLKVEENWIMECPLGTKEESFEKIKKLFSSSKNLPDAIFANNDMAAAGGILALKNLGIQIPEQVGVVGFSNWQFSSMIDPPLSSVSQPGFLIGEKATELLLKKIEGKTEGMLQGRHTEILKTELIIRKSSQRK